MSALAACALALAGTAGPAIAAAPTTAPVPATSEEVLHWPAPVHLSAEADADPAEAVVRFDLPLQQAEIDRFARAAGDRLADLRWNDASLVLRAAPGNRLEIATGSMSLTVRFLAEAATAPQPQAAPDGGQTELELARAQADAAAGYPGAARRRLAGLWQREPASPAAARALGDAEAADGALLLAADHYHALGADDLAARRVMAEAGGRASGQFLIRDGKTFSQWEAGADAAIRAADGLILGAGLRRVTTTAEGVVTGAGLLARTHTGATVGTLSATALLGDYGRATAQVASRFEQGGTGVAARVIFGSTEAQARLFGAWRLPDFSTAEQALLGGSIDRIGGGGTLRLSPELVIQGDVTWNGYRLAGAGVPTTSLLVSGGIDYLVLRGRRTLQISYRLDAEYVRRMRLRGNGLAFIPLSDRENHTVQAIFSMPVKMATNTVQFTAAAGWTWDRFGGNGPTASLGAQANLGGRWRLEATAGVSSVSRPDISGRQFFAQLTITRFLGR